MANKKNKYTTEQTAQAWNAVFECQKDETKYNDHTQIVLSVQDALRVVMDVLPGMEATAHISIPDEDKAKFYYDVYCKLMLTSLKNIKQFDITFTPLCD